MRKKFDVNLWPPHHYRVQMHLHTHAHTHSHICIHCPHMHKIRLELNIPVNCPENGKVSLAFLVPLGCLSFNLLIKNRSLQLRTREAKRVREKTSGTQVRGKVMSCLTQKILDYQSVLQGSD